MTKTPPESPNYLKYFETFKIIKILLEPSKYSLEVRSTKNDKQIKSESTLGKKSMFLLME